MIGEFAKCSCRPATQLNEEIDNCCLLRKCWRQRTWRDCQRREFSCEINQSFKQMMFLRKRKPPQAGWSPTYSSWTQGKSMGSYPRWPPSGLRISNRVGCSTRVRKNVTQNSLLCQGMGAGSEQTRSLLYYEPNLPAKSSCVLDKGLVSICQRSFKIPNISINFRW